MEHSVTFALEGPPERCYRLARRYLEGNGFKLDEELSHERLLFTRGKGRGYLTTDITKIDTNLELLLVPEGYRTSVLCTYRINLTGLSFVLPGDIRFLDREMQKLRFYISRHLAGKVARKRKAKPKAETEKLCQCGTEAREGWKHCPRCGGQLPQVCTCGTTIETGWKHCPGCGQEVDQSRTPLKPSTTIVKP